MTLFLLRRFRCFVNAQRFFERGRQHAEQGNIEKTFAYFELALAAKPHWDKPYSLMGDILLAMHWPADAAILFTKALSLNTEDDHAWTGYLASLLLAGRRTEVADILEMSPDAFPNLPAYRPKKENPLSRSSLLRPPRTPKPDTRVAVGKRNLLVHELIDRIQSYTFHLYLDNYIEESIELMVRCRDWQSHVEERVFPTGHAVHYLTSEWTGAIGHLALIDYYVKLFLLGYVHSHRPVILLPKDNPRTCNVVNPALLDYWKSYADVFDDWDALKRHHGPAAYSKVYMNVQRTKDGESLYYLDAAKRAQIAWEAQGRKPLLAVNPKHSRDGREVLSKLGMPEQSWFVTLHVRERGFYNTNADLQRVGRNADVDAYIPAIKAIHDRGGWVVRIGDASMKPLPPMEGCVDYARHPEKSDWMDVFLMGQCRFFIGTNSGPSLVPPIFGVPCVYTNWMPVGCLPWHSGNLLIHKLYHQESRKRYLTYRELLVHPLRFEESPERLAGRGITVVDNSPEEIKDVVEEMLDRCCEGHAPTEENEGRQKRFARVVNECRNYCGPRIGSAFLKEHEYLLDDYSGTG